MLPQFFGLVSLSLKTARDTQFIMRKALFWPTVSDRDYLGHDDFGACQETGHYGGSAWGGNCNSQPWSGVEAKTDPSGDVLLLT